MFSIHETIEDGVILEAVSNIVPWSHFLKRAIKDILLIYYFFKIFTMWFFVVEEKGEKKEKNSGALLS